MLKSGRMMKIYIRSVQEDREGMLFLMCRYKHRVKELKKQRNKETKEQEKTPETIPNEMEIYELPQRMFKITVIKMFHEVRKGMYEQREF